MDWSEITILTQVGVCIAAVHYLLVVFELGVVRDDIRRLAEQIRDRGGRGHRTPVSQQREPRRSRKRGASRRCTRRAGGRGSAPTSR